VYADHFKISLPSFYGTRFNQTDRYDFKDIKHFEYEKGYYDHKAAFFGELVNKVLPNMAVGALLAYQKPNLTFTDKTYKKENISYRFKSNTSFEKGLELVSERQKKLQTK
jgi:hypothetical protein